MAKSEFKVALTQFPCRIGNKLYNMDKMKEYVKKAQIQEADIIIFPEMSLTGYTLRDLTYELAEEIPGPSTAVIEELAEEHNLHIILVFLIQLVICNLQNRPTIVIRFECVFIEKDCETNQRYKQGVTNIKENKENEGNNNKRKKCQGN